MALRLCWRVLLGRGLIILSTHHMSISNHISCIIMYCNTWLFWPLILHNQCLQVEYSGSIVGAQEIKILEHFFASEIAWACDSQNAARLHSWLSHIAPASSLLSWAAGANYTWLPCPWPETMSLLSASLFLGASIGFNLWDSFFFSSSVLINYLPVEVAALCISQCIYLKRVAA